MKTAILLGAGSSLPAGFPSTQCLTDLVLSGNDVERHSDGTYQLIVNADPLTGATRLANCMARRLHAEAERYFSAYGEGPANYEHLFYLAKQASDETLGEMENPAAGAFIDKLRADMLPLIKAANAKNDNSDQPCELNVPTDFAELLDETRNYIADIVWKKLYHEPDSTDHLQIFARACKDGHVTGISTLGHDTHVETFLTKQDISLADGFSEPQAGVRYWNGDLSSNGKIPFLKLHGSVDWFRFRPKNSRPWYDDRTGVALNGDHHHTKTEDGTYQAALDGRPLLLIGTFNKISEYSQGMFRELHYGFRSTLREADQLVVCGYSFGDKGINSEIIEWFYAGQQRRFVIIHPNRDDLVANARRAIQHEHWDEWEQGDAVAFIAKRLEHVDACKFLRAIR